MDDFRLVEARVAISVDEFNKLLAAIGLIGNTMSLNAHLVQPRTDSSLCNVIYGSDSNKVNIGVDGTWHQAQCVLVTANDNGSIELMLMEYAIDKSEMLYSTCYCLVQYNTESGLYTPVQAVIINEDSIMLPHAIMLAHLLLFSPS